MKKLQINDGNGLDLIESEIIPIYHATSTNDKVVKGRELHKYLGVGTRFNDWIRRRIKEYGFIENIEFSVFECIVDGGGISKDYILTLDMAKELGMVEKNEEGKRIRKYFIEFEKRGREILSTIPKTYPEALRLYADAVEKKGKLELENQQQKQRIGELKPNADYTDKILKSDDLLTITQIAKDYGMSGQAMNSLLHDLGVQYKQSGQWLLYSQHQAKGYTHSDTYVYEDSKGRERTKLHTKFTQKGRLFLYNLLKENGVLPLIEQE